jgi:hypothetical protein
LKNLEEPSQRPDINLNDSIVNIAKNHMLTDGFVASVFITIKDNKFAAYPVPPNEMDDKDELARKLKNLVDTQQPDFYYFINEVFFYKAKAQDPKGIDEFVKEYVGPDGKLLVPDKDKAEAIHIMAVRVEPDKSKSRWSAIIEFHRDGNGKVSHFSPENWVKDKEQDISIKGRFTI